MAKEIERKFLVKLVDGQYLPSEILHAPCHLVTQGYLNLDKARQVRIRTIEGVASKSHTQEAFITIKGKAEGITRDEFEYRITFQDALEMFSLCQGLLIIKTRTKIGPWEVDVFGGENDGLFVAEIELKSEDEKFDCPEWLGEEVSKDPRYSNINLAQEPFKTWGKEKTLSLPGMIARGSETRRSDSLKPNTPNPPKNK